MPDDTQEEVTEAFQDLNSGSATDDMSSREEIADDTTDAFRDAGIIAGDETASSDTQAGGGDGGLVDQLGNTANEVRDTATDTVDAGVKAVEEVAGNLDGDSGSASRDAGTSPTDSPARGTRRAVERDMARSGGPDSGGGSRDADTAPEDSLPPGTRRAVERDMARSGSPADAGSGGRDQRKSSSVGGQPGQQGGDGTITADEIVRKSQPGSDPLIDAGDVAGAADDVAQTGAETAQGVRETGASANQAARQATAETIQGIRDAGEDIRQAARDQRQEFAESGGEAVGDDAIDDVRFESGLLDFGTVGDLEEGAQDLRTGTNEAVELTLDATGGVSPLTVVPTADGPAVVGGPNDARNVGDEIIADPIRGAGALPDAGIQTAEATAFAAGIGTDEPVEDRLEDVGAGAGRLAAGSVEGAVANPTRTAGGLVTGFVTGTASTRVLQQATRRGARVARRRQADVVVDAEEVARPEDLRTGEQATFDASPDAPTEAALDEFETRSGQNPDRLAEAVGSERRTILRSEAAPLPKNLEARQGQFELPGLFGSSDLALLRADLSQSSGVGKTSARLPRPSDFLPEDGGRFSALPGDRIEAAPESAAESGVAVRSPEGEIVERFPGTIEGLGKARSLADDIGGERVPDPDTAGARFLESEADQGTAFVRATGDRTSELEAVFPPGSEFVRQGQGLVEFPGGQQAPLDLFRRPDDVVRQVSGGLGAAARRQDVDLDGTGRAGGDGDADIVTAKDIRNRRTGRDRTPEGEPIQPFAPTGGGSPSPVPDSDPSDDITPPGDSGPSGGAGGGSDIDIVPPGTGSGSGGSGGSTAPPTGPPSNPPGSGPSSDPPFSPPDRPPGGGGSGGGIPPSDPPNTPPSQPPNIPPSVPPSTPPDTPPGTAPGTPPGRPPGSPPGVPGSPPRRRLRSDEDEDAERFLAEADLQAAEKRTTTNVDPITAIDEIESEVGTGGGFDAEAALDEADQFDGLDDFGGDL